MSLIWNISSNTCFNLINPLAWFLRKDHARTMPSLRSSSGADLKVKPMLGGRCLRSAKEEKVATF